MFSRNSSISTTLWILINKLQYKLSLDGVIPRKIWTTTISTVLFIFMFCLSMCFLPDFPQKHLMSRAFQFSPYCTQTCIFRIMTMFRRTNNLVCYSFTHYNEDITVKKQNKIRHLLSSMIKSILAIKQDNYNT